MGVLKGGGEAIPHCGSRLTITLLTLHSDRARGRGGDGGGGRVCVGAGLRMGGVVCEGVGGGGAGATGGFA